MNETISIEEPRIARWLFNSRQGAWVWLVVRVWLGYQWFHAGWEKITGTSGGTFTWHFGYTSESWLKSSAGLKGFAAYALKGESKPAAAELAEARRLVGDDRYSSIARLRNGETWGAPKIRTLVETTYFAGLRKAGVPDE